MTEEGEGIPRLSLENNMITPYEEMARGVKSSFFKPPTECRPWLATVPSPRTI